MALQKDIVTDSNVDADYIRISFVDNKMLSNNQQVFTTELFLEYWKDSATRDLAKAGGGQKPIITKKLDTDIAFSDITSTYTYLKTLPEFTGAIDC